MSGNVTVFPMRRQPVYCHPMRRVRSRVHPERLMTVTLESGGLIWDCAEDQPTARLTCSPICDSTARACGSTAPSAWKLWIMPSWQTCSTVTPAAANLLA
jgi:hypothetical protein